MKKIYLTLLLLLSILTAAQAETSDWMTGFDAYRAWQKQKARGETPIAVECRDTGKIGLNVGDFEYRITSKKFDKPPRYMWAVGSSFGKVEYQAVKKGYTRVSYSAFRRKKSGLLVRCGIWHKQ